MVTPSNRPMLSRPLALDCDVLVKLPSDDDNHVPLQNSLTGPDLNHTLPSTRTRKLPFVLCKAGQSRSLQSAQGLPHTTGTDSPRGIERSRARTIRQKSRRRAILLTAPSPAINKWLVQKSSKIAHERLEREFYIILGFQFPWVNSVCP